MLRLVVVDDDPHLRAAFRRMLTAWGHSVQLFASAEEFLAHEVTADCLILDIHLPGLTGFELEERMRLAGRCAPVVFISAHQDPAAQAAFVRIGRPWLRKPIDEGRLLDAIARATAAPG
jgi:FixJ family two-component response regulator